MRSQWASPASALFRARAGPRGVYTVRRCCILFVSWPSNYSTIFFDAYGVLKNFEGVIDGVLDVLAELKRGGKELFIVTNDASRSPKKMSHTYVHDELGEIFPEDRIISSGLLARDFLRAKVRERTVAYLGKQDSAYYIESAGLVAKPLSECSPRRIDRRPGPAR